MAGVATNSFKIVAAGMLVLGVTTGWASAAPRKPHRTVPAANPRETDTSVTGTLPAKLQSKGKPSVATAPADDETLPPPFHLPSAPRSRVRDCGLKWQAMKESGEVGEDIWRDFATRCLAAVRGPFDRRSDR